MMRDITREELLKSGLLGLPPHSSP